MARNLNPANQVSNVDETESNEYSDPVLKFISSVLMEEDFKSRNYTNSDILALQAAEKSFYDALVGKNPPKFGDPHQNFSANSSSTNTINKFVMGSEETCNHEENLAFYTQPPLVNVNIFPCTTFSPTATARIPDLNTESRYVWQIQTDTENRNLSPLKGILNTHQKEGFELEEERSRKQLACFREETELSEAFDRVLLYGEGKDARKNTLKLDRDNKMSRGRKRSKVDVMDPNALLIQCAEAVAANNQITAKQLLTKIRRYSSPLGDGTRRLAHCFANAIEARLAGTRMQIYAAPGGTKQSPTDYLGLYRLCHLYCPFDKMTIFFRKMVIMDIAKNASKLHIIDFGIHYGFRWPVIIESLSKLSGGPPKLRITGIDLPEQGFRPAEMVAETGRRLAHYCKKFNVPFEFNAIAQKWETITIKDLDLDSDEVRIVTTSYRFRYLPDETVVLKNNPRDAVLNLIREINPKVFFHGIISGGFNSAFFIARFREALFQYSLMFDMIDCNVPRDNMERKSIEKLWYGQELMNVIACEGAERVLRPETFKQWQIRNQRAGLRQLALDRGILEKLKAKVKEDYHREFLLTQDGEWTLQGWKGRNIVAISCWTSQISES